MLWVRSPSARPPITRTTSWMLSPVVVANSFRPWPMSRWNPDRPSRAMRSEKSPRLAAATTRRWPSITSFSRSTMVRIAYNALLLSLARTATSRLRSPCATLLAISAT
ncbi:hypothetical protein NB723_003582 [Xanthomonas sacchari]|nr:hypothetical protein [Xanthomonas sacchari]